MLPLNNLPCMIGTDPNADAAIAETLSGSLSLEESLARLSRYFLVRIHFHQPISTRRLRGFKTGNSHTFRCLFVSDQGNFCYGLKRRSRKGYVFQTHASNIKEVELLPLDNNPSQFKSYEEFKARFDPRFIKEEGIKSLWNSTSGQHGGKYNRSDFRKMGKTGLRVMRRFLLNFTNINDEPKQTYPYHQSNLWPERKEPVWVYSEKHHTDHRLGRDISISYQSNSPYLFYSSEYQGCCNGDYGLIVNKNTYLYLEKD